MAETMNNNQKGRRKILLAVAFLLLLAFLAALYWFIFMRGVVFSDDARIGGALVDMAPQVGGPLSEVRFREGAQVKKGEVLFILDKSPLQAALEKAEHNVLSAKAGLDVAEAQYEKAVNGPRVEEIRIAEAARQLAEAQEHQASSDLSRAKALFEKHDITASQKEKIETAAETARRSLDEAEQRLRLLRQGTRREDLESARATVELRKADLAAAEAAASLARVNLDYAEVDAPFNGMVVRRWLDPGATVAPGTPVLTLLDPSTIHVSANIQERYLDDVAVGDRVNISVDAYPHLKLTGRVEKIMRAANSEFSLIPAEGVSGTYIKVTQRVMLRITLDSIPDLPLGPGLSVEIKILIGSGKKSPVQGDENP